MGGVGVPAELTAYWEARARRFAGEGAGLAAVCSYGMPLFYNRYIHLTQWLALRPWLRVRPGTRVLDAGCGVGRWSRHLARAGAEVTGVDLAPTMVTEARRRAARDGLAARCRFLAADLAELDLGTRFDRVLGVTVLQHIVDADRFERGVGRLAAHLAPEGRLVLLEVAPSRQVPHGDRDTFCARAEEVYRAAFARAGLACVAVRGVDPAPFKVRFLPWYRALPPPLAALGLAAVTGASLPVDLLLGRRLTRASWHKLFVLAPAGSTKSGPEERP